MVGGRIWKLQQVQNAPVGLADDEAGIFLDLLDEEGLLLGLWYVGWKAEVWRVGAWAMLESEGQTSFKHTTPRKLTLPEHFRPSGQLTASVTCSIG